MPTNDEPSDRNIRTRPCTRSCLCVSLTAAGHRAPLVAKRVRVRVSVRVSVRVRVRFRARVRVSVTFGGVVGQDLDAGTNGLDRTLGKVRHGDGAAGHKASASQS